MSWQDVTKIFPLLRCQGVEQNEHTTFCQGVWNKMCTQLSAKECGTKCAHNFLSRSVEQNVHTTFCQGGWNKMCTQLSVKECRTKCAHNFLFPKSSFRIPRTTVLGMFKDSAIILDVIWWSFLTKSATAAMFTSVWVDYGLPPLSSSSTSSLLSWNQE